MTLPAANPYDLVPYESHPFAQSHPDRLATIATLLGMRPVPVNHCRVLELGCAAGGNLIPMALQFPQSEFVGIDLSSVQVDEGQEIIRQLAIPNLQLKAQSILDVNKDLGRFDYILCHGVYSWVPNTVQEKILECCRDLLTSQGVGYVSYNTYPGWHMRGMIRDMLSYHARQFSEPMLRIKQARNLLDFLANSTAKENSAFSFMLRQEVESVRRCSDSYLFHEHLEDINEPIYFYQFADRVAAKGLKYLAEVDLRVMVPGNFPPEVETVLKMLAYDNLHLEQYMDFLRNRMFRQSLVVHQQANPNYNLQSDTIRRFHIASPAKHKPTVEGKAVDINSAETELFETPEGLVLNTKEPLVKAAMARLTEAWPQALPFEQLLTDSRTKLDQPGDAKADAVALTQAFMNFYATASTSLLEFSLYPPKFALEPGEKPLASPLARLQAKTTYRVTNFRHESVNLGDFERQLLMKLDGTRDRAALAKELDSMAADPQDSLRSSWGLTEEIEAVVEKQLAVMGHSALLVELSRGQAV